MDINSIVHRANELGLMVPAFNVAYLPMVKPIVEAVVEEDAFALVEVARLEWEKFDAGGPAAVMEEFSKWASPDYVRLHLDHVPVIDEDGERVDYYAIITEAIELGYHSAMVDGSRLDLEANIAATRAVVALAHAAGVPCEAELGAVLGHGAGPLPPYEELFETGRGFTDPGEAARFVEETGCDWLSVAVGNIHGAISGARKDQEKVEARIDLEHLRKLRDATGVPLVLHGGSGVRRADLRAAIEQGIAKVNIGTTLRQAYEGEMRESGDEEVARAAVRERVRRLLAQKFELSGTRERILEEDGDEPAGD